MCDENGNVYCNHLTGWLNEAATGLRPQTTPIKQVIATGHSTNHSLVALDTHQTPRNPHILPEVFTDLK
jgi:hypothetical protein